MITLMWCRNSQRFQLRQKTTRLSFLNIRNINTNKPRMIMQIFSNEPLYKGDRQLMVVFFPRWRTNQMTNLLSLKKYDSSQQFSVLLLPGFLFSCIFSLRVQWRKYISPLVIKIFWLKKMLSQELVETWIFKI